MKYPKILLKGAEYYFNEVLDHVKGLDHMDIDDHTIALAANSLFRMEGMQNDVIEFGMWEKYDKGSNVTGAYTVLNKEEDKFKRYAEQLGLNPQAREKLKVKKKDENYEEY